MVEHEAVIQIPAVLGTFPGSPKDLKIEPYVLPGMLGRDDAEEAAARILQRSIVLGVWTGASMIAIYDEMEAEADHRVLNPGRAEADKRNMDERAAALKRYIIVGIFTLGIALLFMRFPKKPKKTVKELPKTKTDAQGAQFVTAGIQFLVQAKLVETLDGAHDDILLFPTVKLVQMALGASTPND